MLPKDSPTNIFSFHKTDLIALTTTGRRKVKAKRTHFSDSIKCQVQNVLDNIISNIEHIQVFVEHINLMISNLSIQDISSTTVLPTQKYQHVHSEISSLMDLMISVVAGNNNSNYNTIQEEDDSSHQFNTWNNFMNYNPDIGDDDDFDDAYCDPMFNPHDRVNVFDPSRNLQEHQMENKPPTKNESQSKNTRDDIGIRTPADVSRKWYFSIDIPVNLRFLFVDDMYTIGDHNTVIPNDDTNDNRKSYSLIHWSYNLFSRPHFEGPMDIELFHDSLFCIRRDWKKATGRWDRSTLINDLFGPHLAQFLITQEEPSEDPVKVKKKVHRKKKGNKDDTLPTPHKTVKDELSPSSSSSTTTSKLSQNARKKLAKKQTI
jgi:hypothetical protein